MRREVMTLLVKNHKTGMPVLDRKNNVIGVITRKMMFQNPGEEQLALLMKENPVTVSPTAKVEKAAKLMYEHQTYLLPVVKNQKLVGVITPSDILHVLVEQNIAKPVEEYIMKASVPIYKDTSLKAAAAIIKITKIYSLPVLDTDGHLCGLTTDRDIYDLSYVNQKTALTELGISSDEDDWTWEGLRNIVPMYFEEAKLDLPPIAVKEIMIKDPETVYQKTSVKKAANIMLKNDYGQLPVRDEDDRLVSLVYDIDIIRALYD
jgi:CBS domain-containing protein